MEVVAIAGLPGSGKSWLIRGMESEGYLSRDDMNRDWPQSMAHVRMWLAQGRNVVVSDIEFCRHDWRLGLERELGGLARVRWVFFANDPYKCLRNVLFRSYFHDVSRPVRQEVVKIRDYTKFYRPAGDVRPVILADLTPEGLVRYHGGKDGALRWLRSMTEQIEEA